MQNGPRAATKREDIEPPPAMPVAAVAHRVAPLEGHNESVKSGLIEAMATENKRSMEILTRQEEAPAYYLAYKIHQKKTIILEASDGALNVDEDDLSRALDVDIRVGSPKRDNSHNLEDPQLSQLSSVKELSLVPQGSDEASIRHHLWLATDRRYREAALMFRLVRMQDQVRKKSKDESSDFSHFAAQDYVEEPSTLEVDKKAWEKRVKECSKRVRRGVATRGGCRLDAELNTVYFVNSEGSRIQRSWTSSRFTVSVGVKASDGMSLGRMEQAYADTPEQLPSPADIDAMVARINKELSELHSAPVVDPYVGPAILEGRAAAVWFHEVFGHRIEGHRQKDKNFGQTFTKAVGSEIMPEWLSVYDDPTIRTLNNTYLNGFYRFDDEGVPASRAPLVEKGILKGFVIGRTPIDGMPKSNGHGRSAPGLRPVSRQGNLVVEASRSVTMDTLYKELIAEAKRQGKPYGMIFSDISGGFTNTSRFGAQSFVVEPIMAYRLYLDGRKELVRGVNMSGQPLTALDNILSAGRPMQTFNGMCGAESGWVPVSASAPSLLLSSLEIERSAEPNDSSPRLPPPRIAPQRQGYRP